MKLALSPMQKKHLEALDYLNNLNVPASPQSTLELGMRWDNFKDMRQHELVTEQGETETGYRRAKAYIITLKGRAYFEALQTGKILQTDYWSHNFELARFYAIAGYKQELVRGLMDLFVHDRQVLNVEYLLETVQHPYAKAISAVDMTDQVEHIRVNFDWIDPENSIDKTNAKAVNARITPFIYAAVDKISKRLKEYSPDEPYEINTSVVVETALIIAATLIDNIMLPKES